jgi:hypothetical protein
MGLAGSAIVEDHGLGRLASDAEPRIVGQAVEVRREKVIRQRDIHEPGPGERHVTKLTAMARQQDGANALRDLPRIALQGLRNGECTVRLELAEIGPIGRCNASVLRRQALCLEGVAHEFGQNVGQR